MNDALLFGGEFLAESNMSKRLLIDISRKEYQDAPRVQALGKIEFEVKPQEFVSILGPSGCGKSTLLRLIAGLDSDFEGQIVLGDRTVREPDRDCGIIFQEPRLLPWLTVWQNIEFGIYETNKDKSYQQRIDELLELLGLEGFKDSYPYQLSGGMAQRVALARALVNLPDLLLLDEPLGALDELTRMRLQNELVKVLSQKNTTSLMVTHDVEEAVYLSDRVLIMSKRPGEIVKSYPIDFSRPRDRMSSQFQELSTRILKEMRDELRLF